MDCELRGGAEMEDDDKEEGETFVVKSPVFELELVAGESSEGEGAGHADDWEEGCDLLLLKDD